MAKKKHKKAKKNLRKIGLSEAAIELVTSEPFKASQKDFAKFLKSQPPPTEEEQYDPGALEIFS